MTRHVAADHEFLTAIQAALYPKASSTSRFVDAVSAFRDNTFQPMDRDEGEHLFRSLLRYLGNAHVVVGRREHQQGPRAVFDNGHFTKSSPRHTSSLSLRLAPFGIEVCV
jgi:hypothetical protein